MTGLTLAETAVTQINKLKEKQDNPALMLRICVMGGGCSGFQYQFSFDDQVGDKDQIFEAGGAKVITDATSLELIEGGEIHFKSTSIGSAFSIQNPKASSSCGCGGSFSL